MSDREWSKPRHRKWFAESGFEIESEYGPRPDWRFDDALGEAGTFPFTRHVVSEGYRRAPWRPALYSGFGEPADANARFKSLLEHGNGRVSVAFDLPTQLGLDSDHPAANYEVGRVGVAIDSLRDFEVLLDGLPLDEVPITMNMNAMAPVVIAMVASVADQRGVPLEQLRGTISNDILHEVACRGLCIWDLEPSMRLLADTAVFVLREMPNFWAFNVRAALLHEVGASPVQELGISMAIARAYLEAVRERGVPVDKVARRMSLFYASSPKVFEEAAKLRAARRMWATMLRDEYGVTEERAMRLRLTAVACNGSHFTREDPELNLVRSALGVLACALGGVQTMVGTALDEAYEIPSDRAQELALRVQQIIALESDVASTVDPLGGSYFIEEMTDQIEILAQDLLCGLEESGGVVAALKDERIQSLIRDRAYEIEQAITSGERPIVGVNVHRTTSDPPPLKLFAPDGGVGDRRREALDQLRRDRDAESAQRALADLEAAAHQPDEPLMPVIRSAVDAYATVGEISSALSRAFGTSLRIGG